MTKKLPAAKSKSTPAPMRGLEHRDTTQQALENLANALRALEMADRSASELCPHPLDVVRAEIVNAQRYLGAV
jgi:hypothetical protein